MAIINVELRMMIAERLANDNYREEIKEVKRIVTPAPISIPQGKLYS